MVGLVPNSWGTPFVRGLASPLLGQVRFLHSLQSAHWDPGPVVDLIILLGLHFHHFFPGALLIDLAGRFHHFMLSRSTS